MGLVEVGGGPQGALRSLEKVFGELVLGAKWVEEGVLRKKLVRESHVDGPGLLPYPSLSVSPLFSPLLP